MEGFAGKAEKFLWHAEQKYGEPFHIERDQTVCGVTFPMIARYEKRDSRYLMGIIGSVSTQGYCGESCYFLCDEQLDDARLTEYLALFRRIQDEQVPAVDPYHDFTLISVVLCTAQVSRSVQRRIRRVKDYRQYKERKGEHGWSALRLCVVDLAENKYYCNSMGKSVRECLTRESMPQAKKPFWRA